MTIDWNKPVQTRSGLKARVLCTDLKDKRYQPCVVAVTFEDGRESALPYGASGTYIEQIPGHPLDLVNAPEEMFVCVYHEGKDHRYTGAVWRSREDAMRDGLFGNRVGIFKLVPA